MDNFHLKEYVIDTHNINYIIAAFAADYHPSDQEVAESLKSEIQSLRVEFDQEIESLRSGQDQLKNDL